MSFAQEFLDLLTECHLEILKERPVKFFGVEAPWTDSKGYDIVFHSVIDYEDSLRASCTVDGITYDFTFDSYQSCLFNDLCLDDSLDPSVFILNYFSCQLEGVSEETLFKIFKAFKDSGDIVLFSTSYSTAVEAKIIEIYKAKYEALKEKHKGLVYYPPFSFDYSLDDYYEPSYC